jgi:glucose-6-phosphate isomerase
MSTNIVQSPGPTFVDWATGTLAGEGLEESVKTLGQLAGIFADEAAWRVMASETEVYRVKLWNPVPDGTTGGLGWGATILQPGRVGDEYFMTHGHFHAIRDRAEISATVKGEGALLLMDEKGEAWSQTMRPGTVHYIPGGVAHRVANIGDEPLIFLSSWPSDVGHDYDTIKTSGFSKRMVLRNGGPCLV